MMLLLRILLGLVLVAAIAITAIILIPVQRTPASEVLPAEWRPEPGAGRYAMYAADCMACHTAEGQKDFAGGRAIKSPLGTIYTANITPDPETGIGNWTLDQFRAALVDGIRADGAHLYPAMPYENFRMLTETDIRRLYHYFRNEVAAVRNAVPAPELPFPFDQRWGLRVLNWLSLRHPAGFTPAMAEPMLNRGQYLVQGPGHCAACHSPRTFYMGQNGIDPSDADFLTGGQIEGWDVPPLRGADTVLRDWSVAALVAFLQTGRNDHATANGEMGLVVQHSMQHLSADDLIAIARFLKAIDHQPADQPSDQPSITAPAGPLAVVPPKADAEGAATMLLLSSAAPSLPLGPRLYLDNCAACHFSTGRGSPPTFPALQGNSLVQADQANPLISIILHGAMVEGTEARPMPLVMQGYADRLNDAEIAELANFVRNAWGNTGTAVSAQTVAEVRAKLSEGQ